MIAQVFSLLCFGSVFFEILGLHILVYFTAGKPKWKNSPCQINISQSKLFPWKFNFAWKKGLILTSFAILLFFILKICSDKKRDFHNFVTNSSYQRCIWGVQKMKLCQLCSWEWIKFSWRIGPSVLFCIKNIELNSAKMTNSHSG
jgi:hypothetical protein